MKKFEIEKATKTIFAVIAFCTFGSIANNASAANVKTIGVSSLNANEYEIDFNRLGYLGEISASSTNASLNTKVSGGLYNISVGYGLMDSVALFAGQRYADYEIASTVNIVGSTTSEGKGVVRGLNDTFLGVKGIVELPLLYVFYKVEYNKSILSSPKTTASSDRSVSNGASERPKLEATLAAGTNFGIIGFGGKSSFKNFMEAESESTSESGIVTNRKSEAGTGYVIEAYIDASIGIGRLGFVYGEDVTNDYKSTYTTSDLSTYYSNISDKFVYYGPQLILDVIPKIDIYTSLFRFYDDEYKDRYDNFYLWNLGANFRF